MKKNLEIFIKILVFISFFVPLVVFPDSFIFPFIVPKILLFRSLTALMVFSYALLWYINPAEYRPKSTPLALALTLFVLSFGISTFAGVDPYHSFWDNHERMLGLFTIMHYLAYFFVITNIFKTWREWRLLFWIFLIAGSIAMFVGILQVGNPDLLLNQGNARVASTLGNSIYVGGYGLFLIFVAGLLLAKEKQLIWRIIAGLLAFLALLGMFYSGTRGSLVGFLVGIFGAVLLYGLVARVTVKRRIVLASLIAVSVLALGAAILWRNTNFVKQIPALGRVVNTSFADVKNSARWIAWEIAWQSFKEKPLFGWGPNNFFYAFNKHYNPKSLNFGYGETWFDNAHNIIMNTLAVQGGLGLVSYLAIFAIAIGMLIWAYRRNQTELYIMVFGSAFLLAHLAQNITVFENPTSYLYFMVWLAFVNRFGFIKKAEGAEPAVVVKSLRSISGGLVILVGLLAFAWVFVFNIQPARANMNTIAAMRAFSQDPQSGLPLVKTVLASNSPHIDDIRNDLTRIVASSIPNVYQKNGVEAALAMSKVATDALETNLDLHPMDIRIHILLAQIYRMRAEMTRKVQDAAMAESYLGLALNLSPKRQQLIYSLADIKSILGKNSDAEKLLIQAIVDNKTIAESYLRLASLYAGAKSPIQASNIIKDAVNNGVVFSADEQKSADQIIAAAATQVKK